MFKVADEGGFYQLFKPMTLNASQITFYSCCVLSGIGCTIHYILFTYADIHASWYNEQLL